MTGVHSQKEPDNYSYVVSTVNSYCTSIPEIRVRMDNWFVITYYPLLIKSEHTTWFQEGIQPVQHWGAERERKGGGGGLILAQLVNPSDASKVYCYQAYKVHPQFLSVLAIDYTLIPVLVTQWKLGKVATTTLNANYVTLNWSSQNL